MVQAELGRRALIKGLIALGAVGGELRPDEAAAMRSLPEAEAMELLLARKLTFFGGAEFDRIGPALLDKLMDLPVGKADYAVDVILGNRDGSVKRTVTTVREYDQAIVEGLFPWTGRDTRMCSWFELASGIIKACVSAERADVSYFPEGSAALHDLSIVSAGLAIDPHRPPLSGSVAEAVAAGSVRADTSKPGVLTLTCGLIERDILGTGRLTPVEGVQRYYEELLRADLNGDGIEEMLVYVHTSLIGGNLAFGKTESLLRPSSDEFITLAPANPLDVPVA